MAKKNGNGKRGALKTYKSYLFVEKDPIIDAMRTVVSDGQWNHTELSEESGVSAQAISNWFGGNVKRPQFATVSAVVRALGKKGIRYDNKGKPYLVD